MAKDYYYAVDRDGSGHFFKSFPRQGSIEYYGRTLKVLREGVEELVNTSLTLKNLTFNDGPVKVEIGVERAEYKGASIKDSSGGMKVDNTKVNYSIKDPSEETKRFY